MEVVFHSQEPGGPLPCEQALKLELKSDTIPGARLASVEVSLTTQKTEDTQTDTEGWL
jgi:hypothetical protein